MSEPQQAPAADSDMNAALRAATGHMAVTDDTDGNVQIRAVAFRRSATFIDRPRENDGMNQQIRRMAGNTAEE